MFPLAPGVPGHVPLEELPPATRELFEYDPVKARQLLADAGYPEGLTVVVESGAPPGSWEEISEMLTPMWAEIGVTVDWKVYEDVVLSGIMMESRNEMVMVRHNHVYFPSKIAAIMLPGAEHNLAHYSDPYFTELFARAMETVNLDEQLPLLEELFLLTLEEVAYIPIGQNSNYVYWWPWVKNYYGERDIGHLTVPVESIWLDQDLKAEMGY
ncbi:hypothetical protein ES707_21788 [subsurface metagenome]